ncbi:LysR family transcriptional regulator [Sinorhizobium meliloti]|nr:LysR family transcriptional regulator [Sinorhizobium meliloti]RMI07465.1 LysR family transcriptional regulator [Sinorhizobium meliloti]RVG85925.1 LysR family transcriptional regulator [Sinorhizobium meliloti]RVH59476.1 LysR family transcriptional regulator [Sinorhizobium meliloti]RVH75985.1 LysR family transcriptional regulator [Sinorhizobium meliloti]
MAPVAAPHHPLGRMERTAGGDFFVHSPRRLADLGVKQRCCARESACGNMPLPLIQPDLAALLRLSMPDHKGGIYRFGGIWRRDTPPGPAAAWLLNQFLMLGAADIEEAGLSDI